MTPNNLQWLFSHGGPLKERIVRGGIWLFLGNGLVQAVNLLKFVILGRLLSPADFGLMGIAMLILMWLDSFTAPGFRAALIQKSGDIRPYFDTLWTVQVIRSFGLAAAIFAGAPLGSWFFGNPDATPIIRAIGFIVLIRGFTNPAIVHLQKELDFYREVLWKLSGVVANLTVAISLALVYRNVWALALSAVAAQAAETLTSYWIQPYRPRPRLEWKRIAEMSDFGKWFYLWNVVTFFASYLDGLAVGKIHGAAALGLYQMARQIAFFFAMHVGGYVSRIMFPAFSKLKNTENLKTAFLETLDVVSSVVVPMACFLSIFAAPLVRIALGSRWVSIGPPLQILVWAGAAAALRGISTQLLGAVNRPQVFVLASLLRLLVVASLFYPLLTALGITGMALAVALSAFIEMAHQFFHVARLLRLTSREVIAASKGGLLGSAPFVVAGLLVSPALSLSVFVIVGLAGVSYLAILFSALRPHLTVRTGHWSSQQP